MVYKNDLIFTRNNDYVDVKLNNKQTSTCRISNSIVEFILVDIVINSNYSFLTRSGWFFRLLTQHFIDVLNISCFLHELLSPDLLYMVIVFVLLYYKTYID